MTDQQLADQIIAAVQQAVTRFNFEVDNVTDGHSRDREVAATYLSGANQVAAWMVRTDGLATPQQMERALKLAGESLGMTLAPP